ncbi:hypothetical protein, conserved [Trypanosoma brucei brucei TREU927]|uniref:Uncharacterized protein n=1 Tax=Trypanosoma brucei brucei (strain 927/4 GUTat10.1) TaxID=185431 RepID=Q57ZB8_TRYB2|nr:hypothetical protein, conserved [Trypanosoma brucei brucei TREU927]AAX80221.1 hypothetical protein, conserved [Trypanosoma brucei]AAZ10228.1 hypothetical protein, conserved [Trypanosoma brucei brucei TREU927]
MLFDLAPHIDPKVLQRVAREKGYTLPVSEDSSEQRRQDASADLHAGLPLRFLATPEDVKRAYLPPPEGFEEAYVKKTDGGGLPEKRTTQPVARKRVRSGEGPAQVGVSDSATPAVISAAGATEVNTNVSTSVAANTLQANFDPSFERTNYLGRSFLEPPPSLQPRSHECRLPRQMKGSCDKHAAGIQQLQWLPPVGHLLFAADLKGEVRLYETFSSRRQCIASFVAHSQPVKSLEVTPDGETMSTGSVDGTVAMWDVEHGECRGVLTNSERLPCVQHLHHPLDPTSLILVALDRKVVLYDVRVSYQKYQREYTGHMGTIFNLSLLSGGKKLLTTAEDKTLRTWDFRVPVQIKQIADVSMHAITHVVRHPTEDMLVAQSLNNQALVFSDGGGGQVKLLRHRVFSGHTISGTRCQLAFSPDGRYLSSGDINGKLFIWSWATGELLRSFSAHTQTLVSHRWHPVEASRVVTSAWDGAIKTWA